MHAQRSAAGPITILAVLIGASWCMQGSFGAVQEAAKTELLLSDRQLGLLQGLAVSLPIAFLALPIGRAVDRSNRVRLLIALALTWSAGTLLTAFARSFALLFVARMLAGLGATCAVAAAISIAADFIAPERRGRAMLVLTIGKWAGTAAAFAATGGLYGMFKAGGPLWAGLPPWRATHLILAIASLLLVLPALLLREPARHEEGVGAAAPFSAVVRELIARRSFLAPLFVGQIGVVMADVAASIWIAPLLTRDHGLTPDRFGGWVGGILFGAGILGSILGGVLADRGQRSGRRGGILSSALVFAVVGIPAALFPLVHDVALLGALFGLLILSGTLCGLVTGTALSVLLPNELRGVCLGAFIALAGVIGFGLAPVLVTGLADLLGGAHPLATALAIVGAAVGAISAAAFWLAIRRAPA